MNEFATVVNHVPTGGCNINYTALKKRTVFPLINLAGAVAGTEIPGSLHIPLKGKGLTFQADKVKVQTV